MANTYRLIASTILASTAQDVTFSNIPQIYTDLLIKGSTRNTNPSIWGNFTRLLPNGVDGTSITYLSATGSASSSFRKSGIFYTLLGDSSYSIGSDSDGNTSNTFDSFEIYIPNYTSTSNKPHSGFATGEQNSATAYMSLTAGLNTSGSAITSFKFQQDNGNPYSIGTSFFLYGIKNS